MTAHHLRESLSFYVGAWDHMPARAVMGARARVCTDSALGRKWAQFPGNGDFSIEEVLKVWGVTQW